MTRSAFSKFNCIACGVIPFPVTPKGHPEAGRAGTGGGAQGSKTEQRHTSSARVKEKFARREARVAATLILASDMPAHDRAPSEKGRNLLTGLAPSSSALLPASPFPHPNLPLSSPLRLSHFSHTTSLTHPLYAVLRLQTLVSFPFTPVKSASLAIPFPTLHTRALPVIWAHLSCSASQTYGGSPECNWELGEFDTDTWGGKGRCSSKPRQR